ncbi:uncharacterized protein LOC142640686 isoform X3 [Castanea sativa]|uniref:uncharacterized protein LOC142640686 isoform X3 n=1 Tax=Castanea sativa TaxID=21020 RepID=UPI003F64BBC7
MASVPRKGVSSSSFTHRFDVILSFKGEDTLILFTSHLHSALLGRGFQTFDDNLPRGEGSSEVFNAIESSRISIIIFSINYANSSWCLDELAKIIECRKNGQLVLPIFYNVCPSDVRKLEGDFGEAFSKHEEKLEDKKRVQRWREALYEAANISGFCYVHCYPEYELIQQIVELVASTKLDWSPLFVAKYPIGINSHVKTIKLLLDIESNDVRMMGIYGPGGIGKTTIAKAVYNALFYHFEGGNIFLENVREKSSTVDGIIKLQEELLFGILDKEVQFRVGSVSKGIDMIKESLPGKRILLILDDVDKMSQIEIFFGDCDLFAPGSRIIITTRDKYLLATLVNDNLIYGVNKLDEYAALELFSMHAFQQNKPKKIFLDLAKKFIHCTRGLPLALTIIGVGLFGRTKHEWKFALSKFKRLVGKDIQEQMRYLPKESLPPGFEFSPTDDELIKHYLRRKYEGHYFEVQVIVQVNFYKYEPWELPEFSVRKLGNHQWLFFCRLKIAAHLNRATKYGYWEVVGKDCHIMSWQGENNTRLNGMKRTLVFYSGRYPHGIRTDWVMHEYFVPEGGLDALKHHSYAVVLCRLFHEASFSQEKTSLISKVDFEEADCVSSSEDAMLDKLAGNESEAVKILSDLSEQSEVENEEIGREASQRRQPEVIQVEEMQPQAMNALRPQGVVHGVEAVAEIKQKSIATLSMESLPVGFRFTPTDEQLINHYLRLKNDGCDSEVQVIPEVNVYKFGPWQLPGLYSDLSAIKSDGQEWFFFCKRDEYNNALRMKRATNFGYWKDTGMDCHIRFCKLGPFYRKKTLVYHFVSKLLHSNWIMHEYHATCTDQNAFVLCRLSFKEFMFPMVEFPEPDLFPKTHMIGSFWSEETTMWDKLVRKKSEEERSEGQIKLESQGVVFDDEAVEMTSNSSEEIWDEALQRWPEFIQDEEQEAEQAISTLKPQAVDMTSNSSEQMKFEFEGSGNEASQRKPHFIQDEEMERAISTLEPQGVVFDDEAIETTSNSSEQMEFDSEEIGKEASQRQPEFIQDEEAEQAISTLKPQAVDMTSYSSENTKFEFEESGNEASQRKPDFIQDEELERAISTLEPQGGVFDNEAIETTSYSSEQMEFDSEDNEMEHKADRPEEARLFLMQGGLGLIEPPKDEDWEKAKVMNLMDNELSVLPKNPRCPKLSALFLKRNYKLRIIPPSFFDYMPALQILNLSRTGIKSLPDSIIRLVNLKRLFLNDCHCFMMLSPKVGELKQLEVLDLEGTEIMDLPQEIKKLTNLTCLEVSFCEYMSYGKQAMQSNAVVPCGVISELSQLEELNIDVSPEDERWDAHLEDIVNEVCVLNRLETLKFYFPRVELLRQFLWNSPLLSHFRFTVGRHVKRIISRVPPDVEFELERWERCLIYINGEDVPGDIKKVLQNVTAFFLDRHATVKKLSNFGIRNMMQLKCLVMGECNEVQVIIDEADVYEEDNIRKIISDSYATEKMVLGSLEYLYIYYMKSLRSIWEGSVQQNSLILLRSLTLCTCPQLTIVFSQGLLANLCNLEELKVKDCPSVNSIVSCKNFSEDRTSYFLPNLKKISLHYMTGLVCISSGLHIAPKLEWLSFYDCPKLKNPLIDEISSQDLKKIKGERIWWEALEWSNGCPAYLDKIFVPIDDIWDC